MKLNKFMKWFRKKEIQTNAPALNITEIEPICCECGADLLAEGKRILVVYDMVTSQYKKVCEEHYYIARKKTHKQFVQSMADELDRDFKKVIVTNLSAFGFGIFVIYTNFNKVFVLGGFNNRVLDMIICALTGMLIPLQVKLVFSFIEVVKKNKAFNGKVLMKNWEKDYNKENEALDVFEESGKDN